MKKQHKYVFYYLIILVIFFLNIAVITPLNSFENSSKNFEKGSSFQGISVKMSDEKLAEIETKEITNPKRSYSLGFVSETFIPTQKIDNIVSDINF